MSKNTSVCPHPAALPAARITSATLVALLLGGALLLSGCGQKGPLIAPKAQAAAQAASAASAPVKP